MSRWPALLIAVMRGAVLGYFLLLIVAGGILGFLWLFIFGDDPWPTWSGYVVGGAIVIGGLASWIFCSQMIWRALKPRMP